MSEKQKIDLEQVFGILAQRDGQEGNRGRELSPAEALDLQIDLQLAYLDRYRIWKDAATGDNYGYQEDNSTPKKSELDKTAEELIAQTISKIEQLAIMRRELIKE